MLLRVLTFCILILLVPVDLPAQDPPEYSLAVQLVQEQRWTAALDEIQLLRKQYPGNPKVGNLEGLALLGSGDKPSRLGLSTSSSGASGFFPSAEKPGCS